MATITAHWLYANRQPRISRRHSPKHLVERHLAVLKINLHHGRDDRRDRPWIRIDARIYRPRPERFGQGSATLTLRMVLGIATTVKVVVLEEGVDQPVHRDENADHSGMGKIRKFANPTKSDPCLTMPGGRVDTATTRKKDSYTDNGLTLVTTKITIKVGASRIAASTLPVGEDVLCDVMGAVTMRLQPDTSPFAQ